MLHRIPNHENYFFQDDKKTIVNKHNHVIKPQKTGNYLRVKLTDGKKQFLHRLIAITFLGYPPNKDYVVDHIDRNPENNNIENLRWVTKSENSKNRRIVYTGKKIKQNNNQKLYEIKYNEKYTHIYKGYRITEKGDIYSLKSENYLKIRVNPSGYPTVSMSSGPRDKHESMNFLVHRLVASTFISNPNNLAQVNHKDGNKLNYDISNLEWCSPSENSQHAHDLGLNSTSKGICQFDLNGNFIKKFKKIIDADTNENTVKNISHISLVCNGKRRTCNNFFWSYIDDCLTIDGEYKLLPSKLRDKIKTTILICKLNEGKIVKIYESVNELIKEEEITKYRYSKEIKSKKIYCYLNERKNDYDRYIYMCSLKNNLKDIFHYLSLEKYNNMIFQDKLEKYNSKLNNNLNISILKSLNIDSLTILEISNLNKFTDKLVEYFN